MLQQRQRFELLLMLLLGIVCGGCISRLLQLARMEFSADVGAQTVPARLPDLASNTSTTQRILCMITLNRHQKHHPHIERTWGRRCNKTIFLSAHSNGKQKTFTSPTLRQVQNNSWGRTRASLQYVYTRYHDQFDWFLMVTDQTYVVMENLQHFLNDYAPEMPIYFDSFSLTNKEKKLSSGVGGNLFSREALRRYTTLAHDNSSICSNRNYGIRHLEIARCFRNVGVAVGNSTDKQDLPLFVNKLAKIKTGCCSQSAITFDCINEECFYMMDYIIYRLRPFGTS